jgi:hypothetical protein
MRIRWLILVLLATGAVWAASSGRVAQLTLAFQILDELRRPGAQSWLRRTSGWPPISIGRRGAPAACR